MARDIQITIEGNLCILRAPFHQELGSIIELLGGRWHSDKGFASFPAALYAYVRQAMQALFLDDGTAPLASFTLDASRYESFREIVLAGRTLVSRPVPSRRPLLGKNVLVASGGFTPFERQTREWGSIGVNDATLLARLPLALDGRGISGLTRVQLPSDEEALVSERGRLRARLQQIESDLQEMSI